MSTPGQTLGKYRLEAEIGRGSMGVVYRGYDPALKRRVAIKVLPAQLAYDGQFLARFQQEAVLAAQLRHPGIVTIHDVGEAAAPTGLTHFIVMEYLEGETLDALIRRRPGALSVGEAAAITRQVADALDYAHSRGVVHRDIKPANIMISPDGRATVVDFGLVRAAEGANLTRTGMVMGTPEYMSPEQGLGEPADARSDIYSLGVVLYRILTGKVPFSRSTPYATTYAHINEQPPPLRTVRADLSPAVEAVVSCALAKRREDRYQRAGELAVALAAATAGRRTPTPPGVTRDVQDATIIRSLEPTSPVRAGRGWTWLWIGGVLAAVLVIGALAIVLSQGRGRSKPLASATPPPAAESASLELATATLAVNIHPTASLNNATPAFETAPSAPDATAASGPSNRSPSLTRITSATPTLAPTHTPRPLAAAAPKLTANSVVNVRSGPGTDYPRIGNLAAGQSTDITGRSAAGDWWQIALSGQTGWVSAPLVQAAVADTATIPIFDAPPPPAPVASGAALTLSLAGQTNANLKDGYVSPPTGSVTLGGVSFDLGSGATATTQAGTLVDNPTRVWLPVGRSGVRAVYLLITGGNLYSQFEGKAIGQVRLLFEGGRTHIVDLVGGANVREWKQGAGVISDTRSAAAQQVWQGATRQDEAGVIDMLRVDVPGDLQGLPLQGVEVLDTSTSTVGELDPALNLLGVTAIVAAPTPTPQPVSCGSSPGPTFARFWNRDLMGCSAGQEVRVWSAYQPFERGWMLWREDNGYHYAFFSGGYRAFWYPPAEPPEYWCPDAQAKGEPRRGFSRVWCDNPDVRSRVGAGLTRETGQERPIQEFELGFMVYINERGSSAWVAKRGGWTERR